MKVVTVEQLQSDFDAIMDDVVLNLEHYKITTETYAVMLLPMESYGILLGAYDEWLEAGKLSVIP
jgi:hypothetical protein